MLLLVGVVVVVVVAVVVVVVVVVVAANSRGQNTGDRYCSAESNIMKMSGKISNIQYVCTYYINIIHPDNQNITYVNLVSLHSFLQILSQFSWKD